MKPDVPAVLIELAGLVAANAGPEVQLADRAGALGITAGLLVLAAQAFDATAHHLVIENRAIRSLLSRGGKFAPSPSVPANGQDADLRISALDGENRRLRAALIALHAEVERRPDPDARALDAAIWAELLASTERRKVAGSPV